MAKRKYKSTEEKKKEIEQLTEDRNQEVERFFTTPDQLKEYSSFMSKFYDYSLRNSVLIQKQFRGAKAVGSFKFWKEKGFSVQKGEKGIKILVPTKYKTFEREKNNQKVKTPVKYATQREKAEIEKGNIPVQENIAYKTGHVFDVAQTSATAEDLPAIFPNKWLDGEVENYQEMYQSLEKLANQMNVEVMDKPMQELGASKGAYVEYGQGSNSEDIEIKRAIELNPRNSELQNVKTLIHELAHAKLHNSSTPHAKTLTHPEQEFQAELTAYTVCSHFNIDTSDYSLLYLHNYTKDHQQINDKLQLLQEVKSTSHEFITHLESDLVKEKDFSRTVDQSNVEKHDKQLQETYGDIQIIMDDEVKNISDLSLQDFQNQFTDKHNRNILNQDNMRGLGNQDLIKAFNALDSNWNIRSQNTKMIDPELQEPHAYVVWSEADLDQSLMNIESMDRELAKGNIDCFKLDGYGKTRVNFVIPNEQGVSVKSADRVDLGDGIYNNLHDYLKSSQPDLANHAPRSIEHLNDIYSKAVVSETIQHIYKENLHLQNEHNPDKDRIEYSMIKAKMAEEFAVENNILSKSDLNDIQDKTAAVVHEDQEYLSTTNQMVNLKGQYEKYHQLLQKENTGELTEEKLVARMSAENTYSSMKQLALQSNVVTEDTVAKMENNVAEQFNDKPVALAKEDPFTPERKVSQKSTGLSM